MLLPGIPVAASPKMGQNSPFSRSGAQILVLRKSYWSSGNACTERLIQDEPVSLEPLHQSQQRGSIRRLAPAGIGAQLIGPRHMRLVIGGGHAGNRKSLQCRLIIRQLQD